MSRKLAIADADIMTNRLKRRLDKAIPPSQAAYRSGHSTTEHVLALKLPIERTLTAKNKTLYVLLLDMSKAFDSIDRDRKQLLEDLNEIIDKDELQIIQLLLNVKLSVRCGNELSEPFQTDTGAPQGDCCSATEFTFYLAKTLELHYNRKAQIAEHDYALQSTFSQPNHMTEHDYAAKIQQRHFDINMEYANDITEVTTNRTEIENQKIQLPNILKSRNLLVNKTKTEQYTVQSNDDGSKKCKLLGSYLDTDTDIKNRKSKFFNAAEQLKDIFFHPRLPHSTKAGAFNTYLSSIFLYNSKLWTLTETALRNIDSFHRRVLRTYVLNTKYPEIVSNEEVYRITKQTPWSTIIKRRRLKWLGHAYRLPKNTPAAKALDYSNELYVKKRGRPRLTWNTQCKKQLINLGHDVTTNELQELADNKSLWKDICKVQN